MEEKLQWSKRGGLGEVGERGRISEGTTSIEITYICENTNVNLSILYGEGGSREGASGKPTMCFVHVCHYHYEPYYDVRLECTNKSIKKTMYL